MKRSDNHREGNIFEFFSPGNEGNVVTRKRLVERDDDLLLGMQLLLSEMITRRREARDVEDRFAVGKKKKKKETNRSRDPKWWINEPRINKGKIYPSPPFPPFPSINHRRCVACRHTRCSRRVFNHCETATWQRVYRLILMNVSPRGMDLIFLFL